jgi:hypothetical protein
LKHIQEEYMPGRRKHSAKRRATPAQTPGDDCLTERQIDALAMAQLADDMRKAEAEAVRLGLLEDYQGDGTLELTEAGERYFFEHVLGSPRYTRH